jgi:hypothetical protein
VFSTCLFCHAALGANAAVEHFPVGRRLAFDAAKGRLWAVCARCGRWNLSPLEERWEAIEECERLFRGLRLRAQTDQIGLARLPEGTELVRIGAPLRPEFAAWRYGDQFGRRLRRRLVYSGLGVAAVGAIVTGAAAVGAVAMVGGVAFQLLQAATVGAPGTIVAELPQRGVRPFRVARADLRDAALHFRLDGGWDLWVQSRVGGGRFFRGATAERHTAALLAAANGAGASALGVRHAVRVLEEVPDPATGGVRAVAERAQRRERVAPSAPVRFGDFKGVERLALEMALHEESERRALEGELAPLVDAWRDAEEVAAIADALLLPPGVEEGVARLRQRVQPRGQPPLRHDG